MGYVRSWLLTSFLFLAEQLSLVDPDAELEADFSAAVACLKPLYVRAALRGD